MNPAEIAVNKSHLRLNQLSQVIESIFSRQVIKPIIQVIETNLPGWASRIATIRRLGIDQVQRINLPNSV